MPAIASEFVMKAGDHKILRLTILDEDGAALDLTAVGAISFQLAQYAGPVQTALLTKTLGDGITVGSPATDGIIDVELDPADTADLSGMVRYEVQVTDSLGNVVTLSDTNGHHYGLFEIEPQYIT